MRLRRLNGCCLHSERCIQSTMVMLFERVSLVFEWFHSCLCESRMARVYVQLSHRWNAMGTSVRFISAIDSCRWVENAPFCVYWLCWVLDVRSPMDAVHLPLPEVRAAPAFKCSTAPSAAVSFTQDRGYITASLVTSASISMPTGIYSICELKFIGMCAMQRITRVISCVECARHRSEVFNRLRQCHVGAVWFAMRSAASSRWRRSHSRCIPWTWQRPSCRLLFFYRCLPCLPLSAMLPVHVERPCEMRSSILAVGNWTSASR